MITFAVQYLESSPELVDYTPTEVRRKLQAACEILPISIIILGWDIPPRLVEVCEKEARRVNAQLFRWQPLLTGDGVFPVKPRFQVTGLSGRCVAGHLEMPEFTFMCPNNPDLNEALFLHLENIFSQGIYDGIFLDRMRYPALSNNPVNNISCFCPHCPKRANAFGLDLVHIQEQIKLMLTTQGGILNFIEVILHPGKQGGLTIPQLTLRKFLDFRANSITRIVRKTEKLARAHGWKVGLDCFSPTLAYSVGQDLKALDAVGDWIKVMTYLHTFAPAGIPFEVNGWLDFITNKKALVMEKAIPWLSQITRLSIPQEQETLIKVGLPAPTLERELSKAGSVGQGKLFAGIELVAVKGITNIDPLWLERDMRVLKDTGADGIVLSWDLWHMREEFRRVIEKVFLRD